MSKISYLKTLSLILSPLVLAACSSDAPQSGAPQVQTPPAAVTQAKSPNNDGWVQAAQKHNNSGLTMRYRIDGSLAVGQPVTISLEFAGARAADARVDVLPAKALSIGSTGSMRKQGDGYQQGLKTGEINTQAITVTPTSEGAHFIAMQLSQNGQTSAAGIMLRVGQAGQAVEVIGQPVTTDSGEKLIVMPAK